MRLLKSRWLSGLLGLASMVALLLVATAACSQSGNAAAPTATPQTTIKVSMLIQSSPTDAKWFRNVEVAKGTNAYELTEKVTQGNLKANYYPAYRSHFVDAMLGVANKGANYWLIYLWNESDKKWESLPVGADLYSLKDGHVLAWYYTDTSKQGDLPTSTP